MQHTDQVPNYVLECDDTFLALWPHRFDYLWAAHADPKGKPQWQTESRFPLSDRLILQSSYLYGVRFGTTTQYIMLDIDQGSVYHPAHDPLALNRMREALEPLGLAANIICSSSYSGGLHLYFPFTEPQKTWEMALAVATLLENQGFKQAPGQLELFPNPRTFASKEEQTLYHGHRLPLQAGSYILDEHYQAVSASKDLFARRWQRCQAKNDVAQQILKQVLKTARRRTYRVTTRAEKFLNDLNAEIERGWTGPGMTNRLLGRITMRSYIFGHILHADQPLSGEGLVEDIIQTAQALPGFYEWSNHVHELEKRARDWATAIERTERYFPYGTGKPAPAPQADVLDNRTQKADQAREKIRLGVATLLNESQLPAKVGERFQLLTKRFHIGGPTLYKHKDLWHPAHLRDAVPVENPPHPPKQEVHSGPGCFTAPDPECHTSLLEKNSCKASTDKDHSDTQQGDAEVGKCNGHPSTEDGQMVLREVFQALEAAQAQRQQAKTEYLARQTASRQHQAERLQAAHIQRMRQYLASGDPILMGEALQWLQAHPEHLNKVL